MNAYLIPNGSKDYILQQSQQKLQLQQTLSNCLNHWGYDVVMTPTLEYYQTFLVGFDELKEEECYKFVDSSGKIEVLRVDMTIPIARLYASKLKNQTTPLRLAYCAEVFKYLSPLTGNRNEETDLGCELIGIKDDLEILCVALDCLDQVANLNYTLEIGHVGYINTIFDELGLTKEQQKHLAKLIDEKYLTELEGYLDTLNIDDKYKTFFNQLCWLNGDSSILNEAYQKAINPKQKEIINEMKILNHNLVALGYKNIRYDLGKIPRLEYYTGIIFEGYVDTAGALILSGGRYDNLLAKFNCPNCAVGFSIKLDRLNEACKVDISRNKTIIAYPSNKLNEALQVGKETVGRIELVENNDLSRVEVKEC